MLPVHSAVTDRLSAPPALHHTCIPSESCSLALLDQKSCFSCSVSLRVKKKKNYFKKYFSITPVCNKALPDSLRKIWQNVFQFNFKKIFKHKVVTQEPHSYQTTHPNDLNNKDKSSLARGELNGLDIRFVQAACGLSSFKHNFPA